MLHALLTSAAPAAACCCCAQVRRTAAYVDEIDLHMAELTVRETFDFAARCFGAGEAPGE